MGYMVCWHTRYTLGDVQPIDDPETWLEKYQQEYPDAVILPLFLYDHSGLTMSVSGFSCPWDSGQVGYIVCPPERWEGLDREQVEKNLKQEVATYDQHLRGDVWWFIVEEREDCAECGRGDWQHVDSCGGFYGSNWEENGIKDHIAEEYHPLLEDIS